METFGRFVVYESLAPSDVATLHRAELPDTSGVSMQLALRRLAPGAPEPAMRLFVDEAQLGMYLQHPNITRVYELGNIGGEMFAAMEYVRGGSLAGRVAPVPVALAIVRQIAEALAYVHGLRDPHGQPLGIVHGDLAAAHVVVAANGLVKVSAFGRRGPGARDGRVDLFALGVIAYELLTGRALDASAEIPPPSSIDPRIPPDVDGIVMTALARDLAHRWQHAAVMRDALAAVTPPVAPEQIAAWLVEPPAAAAPPPPAVADRPAAPPVWMDDDGATQISEAPLADALNAAEAAAAAEIATLHARSTGPAPLATTPRAPEPAVAAATPEPPPEKASEPIVHIKPRLPTELEMPTEGTQIGAQPLISFGTAPLTALVGESAARASAPMMPSPTGVSLPDPAYARRRKRMISILIAAAAVIVGLTIVLLVL